jgi:hypothetical protein
LEDRGDGIITPRFIFGKEVEKWEAGGTGLGSCSMAGFCIIGFESLRSTTRAALFTS